MIGRKDARLRPGSAGLIGLPLVAQTGPTELHTKDHSRSSVRYGLRTACKAVDFMVKGDRKAVVAYPRSHPEVAGANRYGNNGVIQVDHDEVRQLTWR